MSTRPTAHPIRREAEAMRKRLVAWRRHLHQHPEPSRGEKETAKYVARELRTLGITRLRTGVGGHGVVGLIGDPHRGPTVALRADMDALELTEANDVPYRSRNPGLMHACGHDGHVAGLLGAAALLKAREADLAGAVKLLFQPAEESHAGAEKMIRDGCLDDPPVRAVAGLHLFSSLGSGVIGIRRGAYTAHSQSVEITVRGQSGHAARPQSAVDAVAVAAHLITAVYTFLERRLDPVEPHVLTFGQISGGTRLNIIADQVVIRGTLRTLTGGADRTVSRFLKTDLARIARLFGATVEVAIGDGYPALINDERVVDCIERAALAMYPKRQVRPVAQPSMGGEDFAFYGVLGKIPTAMCRLGTRNPKKGFAAALHSTTFDFDDAAVLPVGAALLAQTAIEMLAVSPC